ncbi:hypothetical protein BV898_01850 [Hypsibius exemplaris]|uniref:Uncharacterized protein n=1 Tax=Hypsibius exemplaris TaxID=2072580 RepID=A0A1W0XAL3_HYPEX|nr:hypothetical protein BV898_01850 [Hypsibius exemplaris]
MKKIKSPLFFPPLCALPSRLDLPDHFPRIQILFFRFFFKSIILQQRNLYTVDSDSEHSVGASDSGILTARSLDFHFGVVTTRICVDHTGDGNPSSPDGAGLHSVYKLDGLPSGSLLLHRRCTCAAGNNFALRIRDRTPSAGIPRKNIGTTGLCIHPLWGLSVLSAVAWWKIVPVPSQQLIQLSPVPVGFQGLCRNLLRRCRADAADSARRLGIHPHRKQAFSRGE